MRVRVRLFAQMRIAAGTGEVALEIPEGANLGRALDLLVRTNPALGPHVGSCMAAVGVDYAPLDRVLHAGDEISLIPPVQGG